MSRPRESIHAFAARINRSIAGDRDAAARYRAAGDETRAVESEASAARWADDIRARLNGRRVRS